MSLSIELSRFVHLVGLGMLLGGFLTSYLLTKRYPNDEATDKGAFVASHLVAAPGLVLLIISGLLQSVFYNWAQFKSGGYMHAKMMLVVLIVVLLALDIRAQGVLRRALGTPDEAMVRAQSVRRRIKVDFWGVVSVMLTVFLMEVRGF